MISAYQLAIIAAGVFFLTALLTGIWKYLEIAASKDGLAHPYIDIAHRASLMYSFAAILIAVFIEISQLAEALEFIAASAILAYFALAISTYIAQGVLKQTDNQLRNAPRSTALFMWTLIAAELGGFLVLFYGVLVAVL